MRLGALRQATPPVVKGGKNSMGFNHPITPPVVKGVKIVWGLIIRLLHQL